MLFPNFRLQAYQTIATVFGEEAMMEFNEDKKIIEGNEYTHFVTAAYPSGYAYGYIAFDEGKKTARVILGQY